MKLIILLLLSTVGGLAELNGFTPMLIESNEASRRQGIGYSTAIVHQNPKNPEQTAESSVKVSFDLTEDADDKETNKKARQINHYLFPKTLDTYQQRQPLVQVPKSELLQSEGGSGDSQLFNVGYSMSFANKQLPEPQPQFQRPLKLENSEIITGTRKGQEFVQKPVGLDFPQQQDLFSNSLQQQPNRYRSSFTPKGNINLFKSSLGSKNALNQNGLSPFKQKYYQALEGFSTAQQGDLPPITKPWHNLNSGGVEILRSTELSPNAKVLDSTGAFKQSQQFDHAGALQKSVGFDYSNALNAEGKQGQGQNVPLFQHNTKGGSGTLDGNGGNPYGSLQTSATNQIPYAQSVKSQLPVPTGNPPKFPIDTRLLNNPAPIHFDTRFIQEAIGGKDLTSFSNNHQAQSSSLSSSSLSPSFNNGFFQNFNSYEHTKPVREPSNEDLPQRGSNHDFKIYGKPQPSEKVNGKKRVEGYHHPRQARYTGKHKEHRIQTHLRPPPVATNHQRKAFVVSRV